MKAGFHTTDITPAIGMEWPGGYGKTYIKAIHDPLKVRAAVIDDGSETIALVGIDTCEIQTLSLFEGVRRLVERHCGIPGSHVLMAASHTHTGGPLFGFTEAECLDAPELVRSLIVEHSTIVDPLYCEWVIQQAATAVCEAYRRREDAVLSVGTGPEEKVAFNRRFRMANSRSYTHPGKGNPEIVEPAGPVDPAVGVLSAWNTRGELLGCVVNYACHATTWGGVGVSADYVYFLEQTIQRGIGRDAVVVFLNGAAGDVTQVDNLSLRENEFGERWSRQVGTRIGAEALKVLVTADKGELAPVVAARKTIRLKRRVPSKAHLDESRAIVAEGLRTGQRDSAWTFAKEILILEYMVSKQPEAIAEIQALQVGPAVFLANPSEYFCALGLEIKCASPFPYTFVVELANGCLGYVPDDEAFMPTGGGYETALTSISNLEVSAGRKIRDASIQLACGLTPGVVPESPRIKQQKPPWAYGVLGPELE